MGERDVLLDVADLSRSFGGVAAVKNLDFQLGESEILGLIGPNGSGKSTAVDCITGFTTPDSGTIRLEGRPLTGLSPDAIARAGIARTFQAITLYDQLTLDEHMDLAHRGLRGEPATAADVDWLAEFGLDGKRSTPAGHLSYGQRKLVSLATVLSVRPRIAMLDEPLAGVNPRVVDIIRRAIQAANAAGQTFLIVEHNVEFITSCCNRVVVLDVGSKLAEGPPTVIWDDPAVYEAFLGRRTADA
jgi:ABC-type branched-subunit amino acid transport system ATPase component